MAQPFTTEKALIDGPSGRIEVAVHIPSEHLPRAVAVVAHPHPLFAGTMDNKVVTTLARTLFDLGVATFRFNFRGVGQSEGVHDNGQGETEDMLAVITHAQSRVPERPLWLAGFSFGAAVTLAVSERVLSSEMVLVAPAFSRMAHWANIASGGTPPAGTLLIHGERDETVLLAESMDWARPRDIPVVVVPGADHFFHLRLPVLKAIVSRHLRAEL